MARACVAGLAYMWPENSKRLVLLLKIFFLYEYLGGTITCWSLLTQLVS